MSKSIRPVCVNHMNVVLPDFDSGVDHFQALYGAEFLMDMAQPEWHAGLLEIGRVSAASPSSTSPWPMVRARMGNRQAKPCPHAR